MVITKSRRWLHKDNKCKAVLHGGDELHCWLLVEPVIRSVLIKRLTNLDVDQLLKLSTFVIMVPEIKIRFTLHGNKTTNFNQHMRDSRFQHH